MSKYYSVDERLQWLKTINPALCKQTWHNDYVYHPSHLKYEKLLQENGMSRKKINPAKICGIEYGYAYNCPLYQGEAPFLHWIDFYTRLKNLDWIIEKLKTKKNVIDHIHHNKEEKTVLQYGDHYFTNGGQHRLCLAKFLELEEVEVNVINHRLDRESFLREARFEKLIPALIDRNFLPPYYANNPFIEFVHLKIANETVFIKKSYAAFVLKRFKTLQTIPFKTILSDFRTLFVSDSERRLIDNNSKLYYLDSLLVRHKELR